MDLTMLRSYDEWRKRSPGEVLQAVKKVGGWAKVFDQELPDWAHKVRNYFNREPYFLMRLDDNRSQARMGTVNRDIGNFMKWSTKEKIARLGALSGDVYQDESNQTWFQMSPGGTIYHFKEVKYKELEAGLQTGLGQSMTPIFKLISPDGTGGSCETIIKNVNPRQVVIKYGVLPQLSGGDVIGMVNEPQPVSTLIVTNVLFQGSYNYAETVEQGIIAHTNFDIEPHEKNAKYVNPPDRFSKLWSRKFPKL